MYLKEHSKKIINGSCEIYYWHKKNKKKETIVFMPGSSLNHTAMISLEKVFYDKGYSTLLYDQRGTGFSSKPLKQKEYSLEKFSEDLSIILKKEKIKKPMFITHSFSIMPVINYIYKTGNGKKIISNCGSYNFKETMISKFHYYAFQFIIRHKAIFSALRNEIKAKISSKRVSYMDFSHVKSNHEISQIFKNYSTIEFVNANRIMSYKNLRTDISSELSKIKIPVINIIGDKDIIVTEKANSQFSKLLKNFKGIVINGGHDEIMVSPKKISKIIDENL